MPGPLTTKLLCVDTILKTTRKQAPQDEFDGGGKGANREKANFKGNYKGKGKRKGKGMGRLTEKETEIWEREYGSRQSYFEV